MDDPLAVAESAAADLRSRADVDGFDVAVVLGSGWKQTADRLGEPRLAIGSTELPGFAQPAVEGHEGRILAVDRAGRHLLVFVGRTHLYEGHGVASVVHGVRTAVAAG